MWLVSNVLQVKNAYPEIPLLQLSDFFVFSDEPLISDETNNHWFVNGFLTLRNENNQLIRESSNKEIILFCNRKYKDSFIDKIKGNFIIGHIEDKQVRLYSDRFSIKKFFYWTEGTSFIISNSLHEIARHVKLKISAEALAVYTLLYHFTGGSTLFQNVKHNQPGQVLTIKNGQINESYYWKPEMLFKVPKEKTSIQEISSALIGSVKETLKSTGEDKISLSLTGGADTRNLLAVFLKLGIKPHLYTYGNPLASDCVKASEIASGLGLEHNIYDIKMNAELFETYARKIISSSGGLASIHRAHRLMAVEKERKYANKMFLGTLGGEFVKGVSTGDYIVPAMVFENWNQQEITNEIIQKYAKRKELKLENFDNDSLLSFLNNEPYFIGSENIRKLNALSFITAHLHDTQDINLYKTVMEEVYTPFLDIDYLEVLFSSRYSFEVKQEVKNKYLRQIENPVYASKFLKVTYPALTKFPYAGSYSPSEVLISKYYATYLKLFRNKTRKNSPPTFPLGQWMELFVKKNLPACKEFDVLNSIFDIDQLLLELKKSEHKPSETYWLKFTNPIMMRLIIEEFIQ